MRFGKLKTFAGSSLFLLLCTICSPATMAQEMQLAQRPQMNRANCSEAYRGKVVRINNDRVAIERPNGERTLLTVPRPQQALLGVAIGNDLVVCQDGTVTTPVENMEATRDGDLRQRIAETFRRLEQEEAERRQAAAREQEMRMQPMNPRPVQTAPATTPAPVPEPVIVQPARPAPAPQPVRALW